MIRYHLRIALRNLLKHQRNTLLNIAGLMVALAVCFISAFYIIFEFNKLKLIHKGDNIAIIQETNKNWGWGSSKITIGLAEHIRMSVPQVVDISTYKERSDFHIEVAKGKVFKEWDFHFVDNSWFNFNNLSQVRGNISVNQPDDLLLSKDIALKYYGTVECLNKEIIIHGEGDIQKTYVVKGVFDYPVKDKKNSWQRLQLITGLESLPLVYPDFNINNSKTDVDNYIRLQPGTDKEAVKKEIENFYLKQHGADWLKWNSISIENQECNSFKCLPRTARVAMYISIFMLVIALVNFIIQSNAMFWERSKNIGVKKIVGAYASRILSGAIAETVLVSGISVVVGFILAISVLPLVKDTLNPQINVNELPIIWLIVIAFLFTVVISLLTGASTLILVTRFQPVQLLRRQFNKGEGGKLVNSSLIVLQVCVFTILLSVFASATKQMHYMSNAEWGFETEELFNVDIKNDKSRDRYLQFKSKLEQIPGVISSVGCRHVPPSGDVSFFGYYEDGKKIMIENNSVDYGYLETLGLPLVSGRDFNKTTDNYGKGKLIVNKAFLELKGINNPHDTLIRIDDRRGFEQIIGVVDDYYLRSMRRETLPLVTFLGKNDMRNMLIKVAPNNVMQTMEQIEAAYNEIYPNRAYMASFVEDEIQHVYDYQLQFNRLMGIATLIAVIIACIGLYSFVQSIILKRIKEVGVRKVNGARVKDLLQLLNQEFLAWVAIAFIVAFPLGHYFSNKWLETFAYKTKLEAWWYGILAFVVFLIALITISIQTYRIANRNPVEALRYE